MRVGIRRPRGKNWHQMETPVFGGLAKEKLIFQDFGQGFLSFSIIAIEGLFLSEKSPHTIILRAADKTVGEEEFSIIKKYWRTVHFSEKKTPQRG